MFKRKKSKELVTKTGELIKKEDQLPEPLQENQPPEPRPGQYAAKHDDFAFINRIRAERARAGEEYNDAMAGYIRSGIDLEKAVTEGRNLDSILKQHELDIETQLDNTIAARNDARRAAKNREKDDEIDALKKDLEIAQLKKKLDKVSHANPQSELEEYESNKEEQLKKEQINKKYQRERFREEVKDSFHKKKLLDEEEAKEAAELMRRWEAKEISAQEFELELQNTRDFYQQQRAKL